MTKFKTTEKITETIDHVIELTGKDIIKAVSQVHPGHIPASALVEFTVPGGGDYSNMELDIHEQQPVRISWTTNCQSTKRG